LQSSIALPIIGRGLRQRDVRNDPDASGARIFPGRVSATELHNPDFLTAYGNAAFRRLRAPLVKKTARFLRRLSMRARGKRACPRSFISRSTPDADPAGGDIVGLSGSGPLGGEA